MSCTITDKNITHEFADHILTLEDWNHIHSMEQWLLVPGVICNYLSGSKYPTLSIASLAFNHLLTHCNNYINMELDSVECAIEKETLRVQQKVSEVCLQYFD